MISSPAPVTSPAGTELNRATSARRRGLSYLRALSHNRSSGGNSPNEPSRSPRSYFQRSLSHRETQSPTSPGSARRSISRPNEHTVRLESESAQVSGSQNDLRPSSPTAERPAPPQFVVPQESGGDPSDQNTTHEMARHKSSTFRRTTSNNQQGDASTADGSEAVSRPTVPRTVSGVKTEPVDGESKPQLPTIRFFPHQEIRNGRPSLTFSPVSRTLPSEHSIIRVGRYSEREGVPNANPSTPSDAPVGFKSKVVSRKHCEFSFLDGQWQIKDVASSSGTFLNHIRLSQPNTESRLFPIKDGDIVQLGIDFRGGEEMIFRCVKIRIECNRAWQKKPNNFKYVLPSGIPYQS